MLLLFDMMDTLLDDPFFRAVHRLMDDAQLRRWARLRNAQAFLDFEAGLIGEARYYREFFQPDADIAGLPTPQRLKKEMMKEVSWLPGIPELLRRIRQPMGLASNYSLWYRDIFQKRRDLPQFFDYFFFSCEIGHRKPELAFFQTAHEALIERRVNHQSEIIFFDDREENLIEPTTLGWHTVLIKKDRAAQIIEEALREHGLL
ncbi:MAG: HAD-IA family hydrolase [Leptonema illini]|uniref:HAD-IA family hydrolase n=1 Tax=Leptonema illini TaxID=183 RepID=A0A833GXX1_9LEPT|nr:MAG: HAD-IA family hydrolase [Leptonema illini]